MNWKIIKEEVNGDRTYLQEKTGAQLETQIIYTDKSSTNWYGFKNLFSIPYIRLAYSKQISDFFATSVTVQDLDKWDEEEIQLLRSNDIEKYEKLYSIVLERRRARKAVSDPLQQHLALCSIYVLFPEERIDYFDMKTVEEKMNLWKLDAESVAFFLSWHLDHITTSLTSFNGFSQAVLNQKS